MKWFAPDEQIPANIWRLAVFILPKSTTLGYSDEQIKAHIVSSAGRGAVSVAANTLRKLNIDFQWHGQPTDVWGAWVMNTWTGLTTSIFIGASSLPTQFGTDTAESNVEDWLNSAVGSTVEDVSDPNPLIWATPSTKLASHTWYYAYATWVGSAISVSGLELRLDKAGLGIAQDEVRAYGLDGLLFAFSTEGKTPTVAEIKKIIEAETLLVDLSRAGESHAIDVYDKMKDKARNLGKSVEDLADNIADAPGGLFGGLGGLTSLLKVAVPVGIAAYVGFKAWGIYRARKRA
jgi:hypothetical protein